MLLWLKMTKPVFYMTKIERKTKINEDHVFNFLGLFSNGIMTQYKNKKKNKNKKTKQKKT